MKPNPHSSWPLPTGILGLVRSAGRRHRCPRWAQDQFHRHHLHHGRPSAASAAGARGTSLGWPRNRRRRLPLIAIIMAKLPLGSFDQTNTFRSSPDFHPRLCVIFLWVFGALYGG
jgi:hypothetical protein